MDTKVLKKCEIKTGAEIIRHGGTVAFPTDTIYGLGADATNDQAVKRVYTAKNRESDKPLIVLFTSAQEVFEYFKNIDAETKNILQNNKGALSVVIDANDKIAKTVLGGQCTVAVRIVRRGFAKRFIRACGVPITAPSANISGFPSPTGFSDVDDDLHGKVNAIFKTRKIKRGITSTIIKVEKDKVVILRPGAVSKKAIEKLTKLPVISF